MQMFRLALEKGPVPKRKFFQEVKKAVCFYALLPQYFYSVYAGQTLTSFMNRWRDSSSFQYFSSFEG